MTAADRELIEEARAHGCAEIGRDDEDWWYVICDCGEQFGGLPDPSTAVDELLDHALQSAERAEAQARQYEEALDKEAARSRAEKDDLVEQLEGLAARCNDAEALLLDAEGALLGYWTDLPESVVRELTARIRAVLAGSEEKGT